MSSSDRPATTAFKERWHSLLAFWEETARGSYEEDLTRWRLNLGLTPRTARENYWSAGETLGIIRTVYEKNRKLWEYCVSTTDEKHAIVEHRQENGSKKRQKLSAKAKDFFERMETREKMQAGPCRRSCDMNPDTDCRTCIKLRSLKNKGFLENGGE